jgi:hypothetical protein
VKINIAAEPPSIRYHPVQAANGTVAVEWLGESSHRADTLLSIPASAEERSAQDEAADFLRDLLSSAPVSSVEVLRAAKAAGIAEPTLRRAKTALGVRAQKSGMSGGWCWALPPLKPLEDPCGYAGGPRPLFTNAPDGSGRCEAHAQAEAAADSPLVSAALEFGAQLLNEVAS